MKHFWIGLLSASIMLLGACSPTETSDTTGDTAADTPTKITKAVAEGTVAERSLPLPAFDLMNPRGRSFTDLSGEWKYLPDPFREGLRNKVIGQYTMFKDIYDADTKPGTLKEYDWATAPTLQVPGSWTAQVPELS